MEILEILFALVQACGCVAEVMAVTSPVGAGISAVKVQKNRKERRAAQQAGQTPPAPATPWWWLLGIFLFATVFFVGLVFVKYSH
jgi:hypothetical protein